MRSIDLRGILAAALLLGLGRTAAAETPPPFTLTWVKGTCATCKTASNLSEVQFVAPDEAWAVGYMPPGETGAGDYSVLHTRDGGKTWTEIPEPWQHNGGPTISFSSARDGWLKDMDLNNAEDRLLLTHDGGAHWRQLPLHDRFFSNAQYLGAGIGFAVDNNPYTPPSRLLVTHDDGKHWAVSLLPKDFSGTRMDFVSRARGYIAGCQDKHLTVLRTDDGGKHWEPHALGLPSLPVDCIAGADSLDFIDKDHGWLLTSKHSFGRNDNEYHAAVWVTADGGASWAPMLQFISQEGWRISLNGVRFLDDRLGFIWESGVGANSIVVGSLRYTTDGGGTWSEMALPRVIWSCSRSQAGLDCAAGQDSYRVLHITRTGTR